MKMILRAIAIIRLDGNIRLIKGNNCDDNDEQ